MSPCVSFDVAARRYMLTTTVRYWPNNTLTGATTASPGTDHYITVSSRHTCEVQRIYFEVQVNNNVDKVW